MPVCVLIFGCSMGYIPPSNIQTSVTLPAEEIPPRVLKAGDRIQVVYMPDIKRNSRETYRLDNLDEIEISVRDRPDLSGVFAVVPDGWLYAPALEPLKVKNMTIKEVHDELKNQYAKELASPQVNVALKRYNRNVEAFISGLSQASTLGPVYDAYVDRDGTIDFPLIGTVKIADMTLNETSRLLVRRYKEALPGLQVSARLVDTKSDLVTILGEVHNPITVPVQGSISLAEALGLASGWTREATVQCVFVVQPRGEVTCVNQYDLRDHILASTQVRLVGGDMVYVPRSVPADINVLVDQLIRRNIPINANVSYNISKVESVSR
jgi:protein involved in polysaccharide export with SLBB domain